MNIKIIIEKLKKMIYNRNMKKFVNDKKVKKNKHKIGLALGGGGARGFADIGVIKAFEEEGIEFDEIAGTSAGSLVGALYAYGLTSDEMLEVAKNIKMKNIKGGLFFFMPSDTVGIQDIIKDAIGDVQFDELKTKFTAVAVDLITGKEVHLTSGNVAKSVAASCAVPGFFKPVEIDKYRLADGGLQNNVPADVLKSNGCKYVFSVDINHTRGSGTSSTKLIDILKASIGIMMKSNSLNGKFFSDIVIEPDLVKFSSTSSEGYLEMIEIGYKEAKKRMPEIKQLLGIEKTSGFWNWLLRRNKTKILKDKEHDSLTL